MTFEEWWKQHSISKSLEVTPFMKKIYKELALQAWEAAKADIIMDQLCK